MVNRLEPWQKLGINHPLNLYKIPLSSGTLHINSIESNMTSSIILDNDKTPVIPLRYKNLDQVYKSYMPFLKNGGLFIPTRKGYRLGHEVLMLIRLPDSDESVQAEGVVSWVTPENCTGHKKQGVGVEFSDGKGIALRHRIDALLDDRLNNDDPTYTL